MCHINGSSYLQIYLSISRSGGQHEDDFGELRRGSATDRKKKSRFMCFPLAYILVKMFAITNLRVVIASLLWMLNALRTSLPPPSKNVFQLSSIAAQKLFLLISSIWCQYLFNNVSTCVIKRTEKWTEREEFLFDEVFFLPSVASHWTDEIKSKSN